MKFYRINESATVNAESIALNDDGQTIAATFTFDRPISREMMGKNGIFGVPDFYQFSLDLSSG